jgi:quinoprotein glucose dehydrogenase
MKTPPRLRAPFAHALCALVIALGIVAGSSGSTQGADGEWLDYGNDPGSMRFSPLDQLTPANVGKLKRVWTYRIEKGGELKKTLEVTPLMVDDTLYLCSPTNDIIALDAETGTERWRYDPKNAYPISRKCRGVAYYRVPEATSAGCRERIIEGTTDARLIAVDAKTGQPCADFGEAGAVDLTKGMGQVEPGYYFITSAPTIVRGRVVVGGWVMDNQSVGEPSGVIRAYDAATGAFAWAWDLGRPGQHGEPGPGATYTPGTPNDWAPMSADETLGLVYAPLGNATPDYWGGHRSPQSEKFSSSIVALDAETGELRWSFQMVHHDLWDYDTPSAPSLVDLEVDGQKVPALIQPTKQGQLYVLDRRNGAPLSRIEERPVPQDAPPGDRVSPTQPFSVDMPDLESRTLTESDMWGLTPLDQLWCRIKYREAHYEGVYTPPSTDWTIYYPGYLGGMNWGGASIDPERQLLVVNWSRLPNRMRLVPRADADRLGVKPGDIHMKMSGMPSAQAGTPFAAQIGVFLSPIRVPCLSPPYGMLSVIDLKSHKILWSRRLGTGQDSGPLQIPSHVPIVMGVPGIGGSVVTRSGLVFIGASQEKALRAFDIRTGKLLWKDRLPAAGHATPMTYLSPKSGRQFVVIAAGGHGALGSEAGDYILGYALTK